MQTENNITGAEFLSDLNVLLSTSVGLNRNVKLALKKLGEHERADQVYIVSVGVVVMWVGFLILHLIWPEKIPFDYRVILGGIGGGAVAVLNFFLMGMAVQKAVSETDEAGAKRRMQASYSQRNLMQMLWAILAIVLPCFQFAAGILPLLIPGTAIKLKGIKNSIKR